jgi:hypothetical protein
MAPLDLCSECVMEGPRCFRNRATKMHGSRRVHNNKFKNYGASKLDWNSLTTSVLACSVYYKNQFRAYFGRNRP